MKARILTLAAVIFSSCLFIVSCQKNTNDDSQTDYTAETSTHADDDSRFANESDAAANDISLQLDVTAGFAARGQQIQSIICDATIVIDTMSNPRTMTITFNGTNCLGNRTRTGVIVVSMAQGVRWGNAGASLNVTFQNFKVTRISDNKSITINGTQTYTNVSGGLLFNLALLNTITHRISSSNMSVTFDNGTQRTWQVARQRVFTYSNGINIAVTGFHTEGNISGVAEWGTNRFGRSFTTSISTPVTARQDCSFRIGGGKVTHTTPVFAASATFGLNATGAPTGCPGLGNYYMKIDFTGQNGVTHTALLPY